MTERWFHVVKVGDTHLQGYLDALIFLADPTEKNASHITIRGPYKDEPKDIDGLKRDLVGASVSFFGIGNFFKYGQKTVFLRCNSDLLRRAWWKPDFPDYRPHLTIYDGKDEKFARELFEVLKGLGLYFEAPVSDVVVCKTVSGQKSMSLVLEMDVDKLGAVVGENLSLGQVRSFPPWKRMMLIKRLGERLKWHLSKPARRAGAAVV